MSFTDDFDRADGDVGNGWTELSPANSSISANRLAISNGGSSSHPSISCIAPSSADTQDGTVTVDFTLSATSAQAVCFFRRTGNDYYMVYLGFGSMWFAKYIGGTLTNLDSSSITGGLNTSNTFRYTVTFAGTDKTIVLRNVSTATDVATIVENSDSALTGNGSVGVSANSGSGTVYYDNFSSVGSGGADLDAPTFSVAPAVSSITDTTADLDAEINETGDIHWVVQHLPEVPPTIANIQAGQANGGGAPIASGSVLAGSVLDTQITGLTQGTDYSVYLVAQDDETTPNVQASATQVNFSTLAAGTLTSSPLVNLSNVPQSPTGVKVVALNLADLTVVASDLDVDADGSQQLSLSAVAIVAGTTYAMIEVSSDNTIINAELVTAT